MLDQHPKLFHPMILKHRKLNTYHGKTDSMICFCFSMLFSNFLISKAKHPKLFHPMILKHRKLNTYHGKTDSMICFCFSMLFSNFLISKAKGFSKFVSAVCYSMFKIVHLLL